jgi:hypothetical protein
VLWFVLITLGFIGAIGLLYSALARGNGAGPEFRWQHLLVGRRSLEQSSRKQLLLEGVFLLLLSAGALLYRIAG